MMRWSTVIWLLLAVVAGSGLYRVKYQVHGLEARLAQLNRELVRDQEAIHVLAAEWSQLNQPARLADLGRRFLGLEPLRRDQTITINHLSKRLAADRGDHGAVAPAEVLSLPSGAWQARVSASRRNAR